MKSISRGQNLEQFHKQCVCQICTCQKHLCPHSKVHIPHSQISSYQKQYTRHPINTWKKPPPEKAKPYVPYSYINSKYRQDYPGAKPQMRQKIVPRVKNESKNVNFNSTSQYFNQFGPKKVTRSNIYIKDNQFVPDKQPFNPSTTYGSQFSRKFPNPHQKEGQQDVRYPDGYRFNPTTTYGSDFHLKSSSVPKSYKPQQKLAMKGPHDLNTIYRQDFKEKPQPEICPIHKMPVVPSSVIYPTQHLTYNKFSGSWQEK